MDLNHSTGKGRTMLRVDCQSHVFPPAYADILCKNRGFVVTEKDAAGYRVSYGDMQSFVMNLEEYDPARKLKAMDAAGIDVSVLSVNIPGPELLEPEHGIEGARACNDYLAELCGRHPERFAGLASLPLQDPESAMDEFDRAIHTLGLRGVVLYSHINGKPVDAREFEPLYERAATQQVPVVLHPTVPTWSDAVKDYSMIPMVGFMVDTSIAMLRLILGGVLERYPDLLVVHPHCGGVLPYLMPRIVEQTEVKRRGRAHITRSPEDYYRNVYIDLVSPSALAMQYAYDSFEADNLIFASDHPWVPIEEILRHFDTLKIPEADREKILGGNACTLFKLEQAAFASGSPGAG